MNIIDARRYSRGMRDKDRTYPFELGSFLICSSFDIQKSPHVPATNAPVWLYFES